jgi:hypothetical protein
MDAQECFLRIVSCELGGSIQTLSTSLDAHVTKKLNVIWFADQPLRYHNKIGLPEFSIEDIRPSYCNGTYRYAITEESYRSGRVD